MNKINKVIIEALEKAKELISKPENWTKNTEARNRNDFPTDYTNPEAYKFCIIGSVQYALYQMDKNHTFQRETLRKIQNKINEKEEEIIKEYNKNTKYNLQNFAIFNDHPKTTHKQILQLLNDTIEAFSKEKGDNHE